MKLKAIAGSMMGLGLLGVGILAGSVVGPNQAAAQTAAQTAAQPAAQTAAQPAAQTAPAATATPAPSAPTNPAPSAPVNPAPSAPSSIQAAITQQQAEQAALAANPGATVDHTQLQQQNGAAVYDVDFTNGGGAMVDANTGAVISSEAAGTDKGGHGGGADQAALLAQAKVTQQQAEQAALAANAGATVDHSHLMQDNGTLIWDVDFSNGGGAKIDATTGAVIASEAAGTDQGGPRGGHHGGPAPSTAPS